MAARRTKRIQKRRRNNIISMSKKEGKLGTVGNGQRYTHLLTQHHSENYAHVHTQVYMQECNQTFSWCDFFSTLMMARHDQRKNHQ